MFDFFFFCKELQDREARFMSYFSDLWVLGLVIHLHRQYESILLWVSLFACMWPLKSVWL